MLSNITVLVYPEDGGSYNYTVLSTDPGEFFIYCDVSAHCQVRGRPKWAGLGREIAVHSFIKRTGTSSDLLASLLVSLRRA